MSSGADGSIVAAVQWPPAGAVEVYASPPDTATHSVTVAHETLGIGLVRAPTRVGLLHVKLAARAPAGASRTAAQTPMTATAARTTGTRPRGAVQRILRAERSPIKPARTLTLPRPANTQSPECS